MNQKLTDKQITHDAKEILREYNLCDNCLGRFFAKIQTGLSNQKRGQIIRQQLKKKEKTKPSNCWLCNGLIDEIPSFAVLIQKTLKNYEYDTFLVGSKVDEDIISREETIKKTHGCDFSEPIKTELNREIGKILEEKLGKEVDFKDPTIMTVVDTSFDVVDLQIKSLYVYGRYKKFRRDIPQTRWYCKICHGIGCKKCDYTGQLYKTSVEELVSKKFLETTKGEDESFHGAGREDVDVCMLGNGRPFILEIKNPHVRTLDLEKIANEINKKYKDSIEVSNLRVSDGAEVPRVKNSKFVKKYRATITCKGSFNNEKLKKACQCLQDTVVKQKTPTRVAHRRADMIREKHIYSCEIDRLADSMAVLLIETESGTYIKELVSGDNGRTQPCISEILGVPCMVKELDVIEVKGE